jgi:hypothetical protein
MSNDKAAVEAELAAFKVKLIRKEIAHGLEAARCHDVELALAFVDASGVDFDQQGQVVGAAEAVSALQSKSPFLFKSAAPSPGQNVRNLSREEYQAQRAALGARSTAYVSDPSPRWHKDAEPPKTSDSTPKDDAEPKDIKSMSQKHVAVRVRDAQKRPS